jgi:hypothetical protein
MNWSNKNCNCGHACVCHDLDASTKVYLFYTITLITRVLSSTLNVKILKGFL